MIRIDAYALPASADEAAGLLFSREDSCLIAGGAYVRLGSRRVGLAVDLSKAGLDFLRDGSAGLEIGAMTTLSTIETDPRISRYSSGILSRAAAGIMGVQLRNSATIGGTVMGRYGFSDILPVLLALEARLVFYRSGMIPIGDFLEMRQPERDLLLHIVLPKGESRGAFLSLRNVSTDFSLINAAAVVGDGGWRIAVGSRPAAARLSALAAAALDTIPVGSRTAGLPSGLAGKAAEAGRAAASELDFGGDGRASADYRRAMCAVLVGRAATEAMS
jgi:CO/xanthine dehydrogenase FAD-binding subunit